MAEKGESIIKNCTRATVKHSGTSIMVWGSFSWFGIGHFEIIEGIMTNTTTEYWREIC